MCRTDMDPYKFFKCTLWRGAGMTDEEIQEFQSHVGKEWIQLFGYTSTSSSQTQAMSFAWENKTTGHKKVLFQINWEFHGGHYFLNAGAYDYEQEIVLVDGAPLFVVEVREIFDKKDVYQHTLIVLGSRNQEGKHWDYDYDS